ncbi:Fe-S cluster assembly ATPase SufC [Phaeovibrio sulfidiphilus]|uniref:Fe-S cluster assembly ATPase SufC n=1 Tax=Phaeovibrio sulfidiphilus TaxID=1220600 RepID=A0A8J7CED5_9PROT|nr:Fe-S cluster assembly ATPase SufC [Phaeovibrio sulfidiphilus]MBE1237684.1 Fe-S cluster assembly ATPase SufC [Phaeovibrio sulfidiphilus]
MALLEIENLHASIDDKPILKGLTLAVEAGKVHAIMGPNGSGKSTLSAVIAGRPGYRITEGTIRYRGEDITGMDPEKRAQAGIFLSFQHPVEIPGVAFTTFLKSAINAQRKARGEGEIEITEFLKKIKQAARDLEIPDAMLKRALNTGFSGGEKKRAEVLQMTVLEPTLMILDELDSGLDIDALRIAAEGVNRLRSPERGFLCITHYQRLLDLIVPDVVHILVDGRIQRTGDPSLALELEERGYGDFIPAQAGQ